MTLVDEVIFKVARIGIDCILLVAKKEIIVGVYSIVEVIIRLVSLWRRKLFLKHDWIGIKCIVMVEKKEIR